MDKQKFLVEVCCCTFNQSQYITDTMNGFCIQQTNFPYICLIIDDASTDGEQKIIRKYLEDNFDLSESSEAYHKETDYAFITFARHRSNRNCYFEVYYLKENHYSNPEKFAGKKREYTKEWLETCKYEALCEGDDYWVAPFKLQKQVDFLEAHPDYGAVYTDFEGYVQETGEKVDMHITPQNGWQFETMLHDKLNIWTLTTCYRLELRKFIPSLSPVKYFTGDILLFLTITSRTKVYCLYEKTAVYRILKCSASHFIDPLKAMEFAYKCRNTHMYFLDFDISQETRSWIQHRHLDATLRYALAGNKPELFGEITSSLSEEKTFRAFLIRQFCRFALLNNLTFRLARFLLFRSCLLKVVNLVYKPFKHY